MTTLFQSIFAGIMIAIGAAVNIKIGGVAGAVIFAIGLIGIYVTKSKLYTGMIGFTHTAAEAKNCVIAIVGNFFGTAALCGMGIQDNRWISKLEIPLALIFFRAIICGILIYVAVRAWRDGYGFIPTLIAIPAFILCGAEHSIADMAYAWASGALFNADYVIETWSYLIIIAIGNAVGSKLTHWIMEIGAQNQGGIKNA